MKTYLIGIGDEVLNGQIVNTNATYLAAYLTEEGFQVDSQYVVSDFDPDNTSLIKQLAQKANVIICSGGLGPTIDDMTRSLFCDLSDSELQFRSDVYEELKTRFQDHPYLRMQAMVPSKADLLKNSTGQAPGLMIKIGHCFVFALPGVPHEMKTMFELEVLPRLRKEFQVLSKRFSKYLYLFDVIEVDVDPYLKKIQHDFPELSIGIYPAYGTLRIVIKGTCESDVDFVYGMLNQTFKSHIYESTSGKIEQGLFELLIQKQIKVAFAESITGGQISSRLVSIPGVSTNFLGSLVVYSNQMKSAILGVDPKILQTYGAVSAETAECMIQGLFLKTNCDVACAITGIAGPTGGSVSKPIGLVYIACAMRGKPVKVFTCHFTGDRKIIIEKASTYALGYLIQYIQKI